MSNVDHRRLRLIEARDLSSVASLTLLSAFVGMNASELSDDWQTALQVGGFIAIVSVFHSLLNRFHESLLRTAKGSPFVHLAIALMWAGFVGWICGGLVQNQSLPFGITFGWVFAYLLLSGADMARNTQETE